VTGKRVPSNFEVAEILGVASMIKKTSLLHRQQEKKAGGIL